MSTDETLVLRLKLDQLSTVVDEVRTVQRVMSDNQQKIMTALIGDELGTLGIVPRLTAQEEKFNELDRKIIRWSGIAVGVSLAASALRDGIGALFHR